ncbi:hypothetical protein Tco_0862804, partial [Tanacetum coccineum]
SKDGMDASSKEDVGNVPVWVKLHGVPMTAFSEDGLSVIATKLAMIELRVDVEFKDTMVEAMHKLSGVKFYLCIIRVKYEWIPLRCMCCKVFSHILDECIKNIGSNVAKNLNNPNQATRGVPVGPEVGLKPVKQVYRHVFKKKSASTSGNKKKDAKSRKEGKPIEKVDYPGDHDSEDEVEPVENEMASFLASKSSGVGY